MCHKLSGYIQKQRNRNDPVGDFARDFMAAINYIEAVKESLDSESLVESISKSKGIIVSETLVGVYNFLSTSICKEAKCALIEIWHEWLRTKHMGLRQADHEKSNRKGYVYVFNL